jgi:hypothetical protein
MTMLADNVLTQPEAEEELPPPLLQRMVSSSFFPEQGVTPIVWQLDQQHPLKSTARVVRMFLTENGVEVYATETVKGGFRGMRNFVPMHWVRLTEEIMHPDILSEEIETAEARAEARATKDLDDPDDDDDPAPESAPTVPPPAPTPSNGQPIP